MPKHSDLESLKDTIQNIGDEVNIKVEKEDPINDTPIPEEITTTEAENEIMGSTNELMSDIMDDFDQGLTMKDEEAQSELNIDDIDKEITPDVQSSETQPTDDQKEQVKAEEEKADEISQDLSDLNFDEIDTISSEEDSDSGSLDLDDLAISTEDVQMDEPPVAEKSSAVDASSALEELEDLQVLEEEINEGTEKIPVGEEIEFSAEDISIDTQEQIESKEKPEPVSEPPQEAKDTAEVDNILEELGKEAESYSDLQELDSLLGEEEAPKEAETPKAEDSGVGQEELASLLETPLDIDDSPPEVKTPEVEPTQPTDEESPEQIAEPIQETPTEGVGNMEFDDFGDLSALGSEDLANDLESAQPISAEGIEDLDLESFESFTPEGMEPIPIEEPPSESIPVPPVTDTEEVPLQEVPEELSSEDIQANKDTTIKLTDEQRKQIVVSLTFLPKEAELKISKTIISGKYSNKQLKPLIDALIKEEKPQAIIKYYEKITGDTTLSKIEAIKYTGEEFEEMQKTFAYVFQKNVLPILSMIASAAVVIFGLVFLTIRLLIPTWQATSYYERGKDNIENKIFWEVEDNFKRAYEIQPRYGEVVEYARLYRNYKRYLEAEKKYEFATNLKPNRVNVSLEYADFFREIKDFERAEKKYANLINYDEENIDAVLGLAKTYYDWSEEENEKIENAKEAYLDALAIEKKNKKAIYGKLNIYLKEKNHKEILKHYNFIKKNFKRKVDPFIYAKLAKYMIDTGDLIEVKNVLEKAAYSLTKKDLIPEIDYQYARYKENLNIFNDQRSHLINALNVFENMRSVKPDKYETQKYQELLSKVYNDLGENYDRSEKANIKAESYFIKSIQADPYYGRPYYNLANFALNYKTNGYKEAMTNYLEAEQRGYSNDRMYFNLGWLYYKEKDYYNSYKRINKLLNKYPENNSLKFMTGTIFYRLGKYDLSLSMLLENYNYFKDLKDKRKIDPELEEHREILDMTKKISNNLGAAYQKKYEITKNSKNIINATKYYSDSINIFELLATTKPLEAFTSDTNIFGSDTNDAKIETLDKFRKENAHINLRMVLYPDAGLGEPIIYEDFPLDYKTSYK